MDFIKAKGTKLVGESGNEVFLKGFGLGGWLLPEGYMWKLYGACDRPRRMEQLVTELCGKEYNEMFWKKYRESFITKWDIEFIAAKGFNCVRLPMNSRILYKEEGESIVFIWEEINRIDELLHWCEESDIYVILDMHGAPGGQTGTNIDDCENDQPELFQEEHNQEILCCLWGMIAQRYANRPCIAGYDFLNEPLPNWFSQYNDKVMPLYRRIASNIRKYDQKHMLILEGVHWATDLTIFDDLRSNPLDENIMLQFHKYWSCPDADSIGQFLAIRDKLQVPLLMGEGGENNASWYVGMFSLLRSEDISYSFWSYKKMDTHNSPISFPKPQNWQKLLEFAEGKTKLASQEAITILNQFLQDIIKVSINESVINSIERRAPLLMPAEFYSTCFIEEKMQRTASLRKSEPVPILFVTGSDQTREPDYQRYGGESQPEEERLCIQLDETDWVTYEFFTEETNLWEISFVVRGCGDEKESILCVSVDEKDILIQYRNEWHEVVLEPLLIEQGKHVIKLIPSRRFQVDEIDIRYPKL